MRCERAGNGRAPRASWAVAPGPLALGAAVIALSTFTDSVRNLAGLATGARGPSPDEARKELSRLSVNYSQETFVEHVEQGDQAASKLFLAAGMDANAVVGQEGNTARAGSWTSSGAEG